MSIRTGKPCSTGSGSPFIPNASIASSTSSAERVGAPMVMPLTERQTSWELPDRMPFSRRNAPSGTPIQRAVPASLPPTSLETQVSVTSRSMRSSRLEEVGQRVAARGVEHPGHRQPVVARAGSAER